MITKRLLTQTAALLLTAVLGVLPVYADTAVDIAADQFNNLGVTLGKLSPAKQIPLLTAPAKVVIPASKEFIVSAAQAGLITQLTAATGDSVKKGAVLAQINSPELLSMQRNYLKALSEMQLGALSFQRDKKLLAEGVIANRRWQETLSQYNAFVSEADEHRQLLEIAGMSDRDITQLGKSHRLSSQLTLYAPITGVVIERMAVAGARIDILAPLYRVANLDELWLELNIPHERIGSVKVGDQVLIDNSAVSATITLLGQSVNPENQTLMARAVIDKQTAAADAQVVRPGQTVNTQIIQTIAQTAYKVPNTAIAQHEGKSYVFIRTPKGFKASVVDIIGKQADDTIISGDFTGDEDLAVSGAVALKATWLGLGGDE